MATSTRRRALGALVSLALFLAALWVLRGELRAHTAASVLRELLSLPRSSLALSLACTALGYLALTGHDVLALKHLGRSIPYRRVAFASFIAFAFANNLPLSIVTGATVRLRLYGDPGLSATETAEMVAFNTITYVVGLLTCAGIAVTFQPALAPGFLRLPLHSGRPIGVVVLAIVLAYLAWSAGRRRPLRLGGRALAPPTLPEALAQILVSSLDWVLSGLALYCLLPRPLPFLSFFVVFLLAQLAALIAQVPGGLGIIEAVVVWALGPGAGAAAVAGAVLAYRVIYFVLPLVLATVLWGGREMGRWRSRRRA
ncbi:MAG TPA: lysylphosphatidylglycerol synthase domain-containing protein [Gemmatimonadales bacterium]|nr:lysylphosphatidylglycerol synthase domain-containing protein [Gemmatimonadales bacterium]